MTIKVVTRDSSAVADEKSKASQLRDTRGVENAVKQIATASRGVSAAVDAVRVSVSSGVVSKGEVVRRPAEAAELAESIVSAVSTLTPEEASLVHSKLTSSPNSKASR